MKEAIRQFLLANGGSITISHLDALMEVLVPSDVEPAGTVPVSEPTDETPPPAEETPPPSDEPTP